MQPIVERMRLQEALRPGRTPVKGIQCCRSRPRLLRNQAPAPPCQHPSEHIERLTLEAPVEGRILTKARVRNIWRRNSVVVYSPLRLGRTGKMRRLVIVVAALSVGACEARPAPSTTGAPVVVNPRVAAQLPDDGCPKVGEKAVAQSGQIAWTSSWDELPTVELIRNGEGEAWFLPTAWNKRTTGSYVGQNAFGARVAVTVQTVVTKGVAALDDEKAKRVFSRSLLRGYGGYLSDSPTSFNLGPDRRIWLAGPKVGGRFDWETSREAKINSPHESTYQYRADFTIKVECSAIVDKSGVMLQRT